MDAPSPQTAGCHTTSRAAESCALVSRSPGWLHQKPALSSSAFSTFVIWDNEGTHSPDRVGVITSKA